MKKIKFKKIIKEVLFFIVALFIISNILNYFNAPKLNSKKIPNFTAKTLNNYLFSSTSVRKKPILIHFWATWCPICKVENSSINSLSSKFNVITIVESSGNNQKIKKFLKKYHLKFHVINDNSGTIASLFHITAFPTTFIYSSKNKLLFSDVGYSSYIGLYLKMYFSH